MNSGGLNASGGSQEYRSAFVSSLRMYGRSCNAGSWIRIKRKAQSIPAKNDSFLRTTISFPASYVNKMKEYRTYQAKLDERLSRPKYRRKCYRKIL